MRRRSVSFDDHFSQATLFWNSQTSAERDHLVAAFIFELSQVDVPAIRQRMVDNLAHVDIKLASRVAASLGIAAPDAKAAAGRIGFRNYLSTAQDVTNPALKITECFVATCKTRTIAILVANGIEGGSLRRLQQDFTAAGAVCKLVGERLGTATTLTGKSLMIDHTMACMPSVMFDAVVIPACQTNATLLSRMGQAVHFVLEAYIHCKTICALNEGTQLLDTLGFSLGKNPELITVPTPGVLMADIRKVLDGQVSQDFIAAMKLHRHWNRLNIDAIPG